MWPLVRMPLVRARPRVGEELPRLGEEVPRVGEEVLATDWPAAECPWRPERLASDSLTGWRSEDLRECPAPAR